MSENSNGMWNNVILVAIFIVSIYLLDRSHNNNSYLLLKHELKFLSERKWSDVKIKNIEIANKTGKLLDPTESLCPKIKLIPKSYQHPYTALASFMGSGNTWTRHLLQLYTGFSTGSLYNDHTISKNSDLNKLSHPLKQKYCQSHKYSEYIAIKNHRWPEYWSKKEKLFLYPGQNCEFKKVLLLVRNPFDAAVSEYKRRHSRKSGVANAHTTVVTKDDFLEKWGSYRWTLFQKNSISHWLKMIENWTNVNNTGLAGENIYPICYESLKDRPVQLLKEIVEFLGFTKSSIELHENCVLQNLEGQFHRKPSFFNYEVYNNQTILLYKKAILKAKKLFMDRGLIDCTEYFDLSGYTGR